MKKHKKAMNDHWWNFILKLYRFGKIERCDFHTEMGLYFGYNRCCVKLYTNYIEMGIEFPGLYMNTMYGYDQIFHNKHVRCLKCRGKSLWSK